MSWKLTGHPKTQRITKALAEKFANMEAAPQDRPMSENRLRVYEKIVKEGGFRPCSWAAAFCKATGCTYRVNGKHTATLFSTMDLDTVQDLYAVVKYYECETLEDVARLYSTYDSKTITRTAADINRSFASCVPQLIGVSDRLINLSPSAICYVSYGDTVAARMQTADRAEKLLDHWDFVVWADKLLGHSSKSNSQLKRMAVLAAMYATFVKAPRIAEEFWTAVRDETGATPTEPTRKLGRFLVIAGSGRGDGSNKRLRVRDKEYYTKCLHAWNAYRAGETTNLNYHADKPVPMAK